jgi:hypothetical protein
MKGNIVEGGVMDGNGTMALLYPGDGVAVALASPCYSK